MPFIFGDEVILKPNNTDSTLKELRPETRFFVMGSPEKIANQIPIVARRNGLEKTFWVTEEEIEYLG